MSSKELLAVLRLVESLSEDAKKDLVTFIHLLQENEDN